jgi:hypothetical protein
VSPAWAPRRGQGAARATKAPSSYNGWTVRHRRSVGTDVAVPALKGMSWSHRGRNLRGLGGPSPRLRVGVGSALMCRAGASVVLTTCSRSFVLFYDSRAKLMNHSRRMLGDEPILLDRQRTPVEGPRPRKVALEQGGKVVEAQSCAETLGPECLFADRQRALEQWPRPRKVAPDVKQSAGATFQLGRDDTLQLLGNG